jgi:sugar phosphate isomerase/epimerase
MTQTRRNFLATMGAVALGAVTRDAMAAAPILAPKRKIDRVGLQLYTVRDLMKADMPGTLAKVANIGYKEVEFAGYFGRSPDEVRKLLQKNHLTSPSTHLGFESLDNWKQVIEDSKRIGHEWITIPWIPEEKRQNIEDWRAIASRFNRAGAQARAAGLRFAYHNHNFELAPLAGTRALDVLLNDTDPGLVDFEMDMYWVVFGGGEPIDYFNRFPGRFPLVHVKDSAGPPENKMADVGKGTIDWPKIFSQSKRAGIKHYFVEHDQPENPIESIRNSYRYLHAVRFA